MRIVGWIAAVALGVGALGAPSLAAANSPAPFSRSLGGASGVVLERRSPVVVTREDLVIDCTRFAPLHPQCRFVATYHLENPAPAAEEVVGAFYTLVSEGRRKEIELARSGGSPDESGDIEAELDGADVRTSATPAQLDAMDRIVRSDPEVTRALDADHLTLERSPFAITVGAGARARLIFAGRLEAIAFTHAPGGADGYAFPAPFVRHPLLAPQDSVRLSAGDDEFFYAISPLSNWAGDPEVFITVRRDPRNGFDATGPGTVWTDSGAEARTVVRASARKNLRFRLSHRPFPLVNGGSLVGIGPRIGRSELRVRMGYEISGPDWVIYGVAAETNFQSYLVTALTAEAATKNVFFIIPSLGVGGGPVLQLRKDEPTRVGGRLVTTLSFPFVSVLLPLDFYVAPNSSGSRLEGAFLTQLSF